MTVVLQPNQRQQQQQLQQLWVTFRFKSFTFQESVIKTLMRPKTRQTSLNKTSGAVPVKVWACWGDFSSIRVLRRPLLFTAWGVKLCPSLSNYSISVVRAETEMALRSQFWLTESPHWWSQILNSVWHAEQHCDASVIFRFNRNYLIHICQCFPILSCITNLFYLDFLVDGPNKKVITNVHRTLFYFILLRIKETCS